MGLTPVGQIAGNATTTDSYTNPSDQPRLNPAISAAVQSLNEGSFLGQGREVSYLVDPASRLPVVRVIDSDTREVVSQWPSEYALALAAQYVNGEESAI